ncbi:unnamed protein product [Cylicocyclus nassatus]|uniref:Uncharacterized protein n=1 Tax=Cylicocyclus nassatus TaxID=53992 RepID=A0AA36H8Y6_CYLNA|nr:unnamed protein product [Cylicocyclus nassatus]
MVVDEVTWTIKVQFYRGVSDMPAQQLLYGVPRWNAEYGCSKCYIQGLRVCNQRVWVPSNHENALLEVMNRMPQMQKPDSLE